MKKINPSKTLELFDNPTIGQISTFLIFKKELTAGQLAKIIGKNISTITRNLEKMHEADLILISKTEEKGNLQVKYWSLNPEIVSLDSLITNELINQLPVDEKNQAINRIRNILVVFRGILKTVYDYKVETVIKDISNSDKSDDSHLFTVFLFNEETGRLFEKQYKEFQKKFFEEHGGDIDSLGKIYSNSIIAFMLSARIGDAIPPI
ncbi:MAG: helix-turn-helix domain-containing protein [Candidatus Hodarchaeales archaeon]|jgi:DNA-binding transcriptional ArsR family regulator